MVKTSEPLWLAKIADFKRQQSRTESECASFLYDILQGLYEEISEAVKVELLYLLQEFGESLIQSKELAEHAVGSIKSILKDLLVNQHKIPYIINCLVTTTTLIIQFELNQFNRLLVQEITEIFVGLCKQVNVPNRAVLRKAVCDCLFELETAIPLVVSRYIDLLFKLTKEEKSFASQSYMLVLSTVLCNILQYNEGELTFNEEPSTVTWEIDDGEKQQITSFIAGDLSNMSPVILWQIGQKIGFLFQNLYMPNVVLQNKMIQCCHSYDLQVFHLGLLLGFDHLQGFVTSQDLNVMANCLLRLIKLPVFPNGVILMALQWFFEVVKQIEFLGDSQNLLQEVFQDMVQGIPFDPVNIMNGKVGLLANLLELCPISFDFMKCLDVPLKMVKNGVCHPYCSLLYRALYIRFNQAIDKNEKEKIAELITQMTIEMPGLLGHTIDFITAIKKGPEEQIMQNIIRQIAGFILKLERKLFFAQSENYFPLIEQACSETSIWPYGVIKWLRSLCTTSTLYKEGMICGSWKFGSELLSICKAILRTHGSSQILQELADLLWLIHKRYQDQDIRDRALFFYMIIGCASPRYFAKLFAHSGTDPQLVGKKDDVEIAADLVQGVLPTLRFDRPCFTFEKSVQLRNHTMPCPKEDLYSDVETYTMVLEQHCDKGVELNVKVRFCEGKGGDSLSRAYALTVKFNGNGKCEELPDALIPYISTQSRSEEKASNEQIVKLHLYPFESSPFDIAISCTFMNEQGRICVAPAKSLKLSFSDFFQPLISASNDSGNFLERKIFFQSLWEHFSKSQKLEGSTCTLSVKRLDISDYKIIDILEGDLKAFCVEKAKNMYKFGIFLSPVNHLLMDFRVSKEETMVWICMDNWKFLDFVGTFLDELVI